MARKPIIAGNWKMHGSRESVAQLLSELAEKEQALPHIECIVFPPAIFIDQVANLLSILKSPIAYGAQDVSSHEVGAFTGDISAQMLVDFGCRYVLVGHSERRQYHAETDELVAKKYLVGHAAGLQPIVCVGETLEARRAGKMESVITAQIEALLAVCETADHIANLVIAYEPVWAIGTGETATPAQAQEVHALIRSLLATHDAQAASQARILYGGSVKPDNAKRLFAMPDIDGGLIGGASLVAGSFIDIAKAVE